MEQRMVMRRQRTRDEGRYAISGEFHMEAYIIPSKLRGGGTHHLGLILSSYVATQVARLGCSKVSAKAIVSIIHLNK
jgi:hypothetical protein